MCLSGSSDTPWARWTRTWVADENRHGDAMSRYMFLTGRVNMRAVEVRSHWRCCLPCRAAIGQLRTGC